MLYKSEENVKFCKKPLSEGCINGDHLLKKSGWSDQYLHFYRWFSGWCDGENWIEFEFWSRIAVKNAS